MDRWSEKKEMHDLMNVQVSNDLGAFLSQAQDYDSVVVWKRVL